MIPLYEIPLVALAAFMSLVLLCWTVTAIKEAGE